MRPNPERVLDGVPCLEWQGALYDRKHEHGAIRVNGKTLRVHRVAWEQVHGPIPAGVVIRHRCDNGRCAEVRHLEAGTQTQNMRDIVTRGRWRANDPNRPHPPAPKSKLTPEKVAAILADPRPNAQIAREQGVSGTWIGRLKAQTAKRLAIP